MTNLVVRKAGVPDAQGIAMVHVRSWQEAYKGQVDQAHLDSLDPATRAERWTEGLARDGWPRAGTLVAVHNTEIVGFATFGPARRKDEDQDSTTVGELQAIYVLPGQWRGGVGRTLMVAALDALTTAGFTEVVLWVLDGNVRAERFYASTGWRPDGGRSTHPIGGQDHDVVRMRRAVG